MNSVLLAGLAGSWYFICATRSLRNVSLPIWSERSTVVVAVLVAVPPTALTAFGIGRSTPSQTSRSTPDDVDRVVGTGRPAPVSAARPHGRDLVSPRSWEPARSPEPCCWADCCADCWLSQEPLVSRSISSREQVRPAVCRSRRRSGSASTRAARPCSWAPRRVRSTVPWRTVTCTSTGPRVSGVRTRVIVCRPSGALRSTATCRTTCEATGWAGGAAAGVASGAAVAVGPVAGGAAPTVVPTSVESRGADVGATAVGAEPGPVPSPAAGGSEPPAARRRSMPVTGAVDTAASGSPDGAAVATGEGVTTCSGAAASTVTTVTPASAARVSAEAPAAALPGEGTAVRADAGAVCGTTVPVGDVPTTAGGAGAGEGGEGGTVVWGSAAAGTAAAMSPAEAGAAPTGSAVAAAVTAGVAVSAVTTAAVPTTVVATAAGTGAGPPM